MLMISKDKVTEMFCFIDDFCKEINKLLTKVLFQMVLPLKDVIENIKCHKAK